MLSAFSRIYLIFLCILCSSLLHAEDQISLIVPDFKPYTYLEEGKDGEEGKYSGIGVEAVSALMERLGLKLELKFAPNYGRALAETKAGRVDGFFMASQNSERDAVAIFSEPLMFNNWSWFTLANAQVNIAKLKTNPSALVGTIINTNTHRWLLNEGYNVSVAAQNAKELLALLVAGRCDVLFLAESAFISAASEMPELTEVNQVVEIAKPFGIYIARDYVSKHPEFMERLNAQILSAH